jgi:hypothetical protein
MIWFFAWILGAALCSFFARSLNRNVVGVFFVSVLTSPFVVFLYLLFAGKNGKSCPKCAETIKYEATKCMHCSHDFTVAEVHGAIKTLSTLLESNSITKDEFEEKKAVLLKRIS